MGKKPIFAYMIQLSAHMWADENSVYPSWYPSDVYNENNNVDLDVWDSTVRFLADRKYNMLLIDVGDAIKYESHPEISAPDAWDKDFMKKKLDEIRALGMEPIPKLNFSACHDTWLKEYRRMLSTPAYYKACADVIAEVCELFGYPRFFHLGLDEEVASLQSTYECAVIRSERLWWHDAYFFFAECEKHGARPWVWADYMWDHFDLYLEKMPKSVIQSNWYYHDFKSFGADHKFRIRIESYEKLDELGYDQIPTCSAVFNYTNPYQTVGFCKERLNPEHLLGIMDAPWVNTEEVARFHLQSDAHRLYLARQKWYPETL